MTTINGGANFSWDEFAERFLVNHEEFVFIYSGKKIYISNVSNKSTSISYGNNDDGFVWKDFNSPKEFLEAPIFDGKSFKEIWAKLD